MRIDEGIACCRFGLVILSNSFFGKDWPEYELRGLATRAIGGEIKLIPVWHEISQGEVRSYSAALADIVAFSTSKLGIDKIAEKIAVRIASDGVDDVAANFSKFKWNPLRNKPKELGTDLWVQARGIDRGDVAFLVGVQVRTGDFYFGTPGYKDGAAGWWHDGLDDRHVEHWFRDGDTHLLVLHDHHTKVSYWERVNRDTAVSTARDTRCSSLRARLSGKPASKT